MSEKIQHKMISIWLKFKFKFIQMLISIYYVQSKFCTVFQHLFVFTSVISITKVEYLLK